MTKTYHLMSDSIKNLLTMNQNRNKLQTFTFIYFIYHYICIKSSLLIWSLSLHFWTKSIYSTADIWLLRILWWPRCSYRIIFLYSECDGPHRLRVGGAGHTNSISARLTERSVSLDAFHGGGDQAHLSRLQGRVSVGRGARGHIQADLRTVFSSRR